MTATAQAVGCQPRGRADDVVAALGDRAVLCDVYDEIGSPVYHDLSCAATHEVRELLSLVRRTRGPVLELAAGSGRLTMPLLASSREVTALELSGSMLDILSARLAAAPARLRDRCTTVRADMSAFCLGATFGAVVLGTTSVSLLDEAGRTGLYRSVREHLAPGGRFLLSTIDMLSGVGPDEVELEFVADSGLAYRLFEHWLAGSGVRTVTILPAEPGADGPVPVCTTSIRVLSADHLASELARAGLTVRSRQLLPSPAWRHRGVLLEATADR